MGSPIHQLSPYYMKWHNLINFLKPKKNEPLHPGKLIRHVARQKGLRTIDLAQRTGISRNGIRKIITGKSSKLDTQKFGEILGIPPSILQDLQEKYDR